MHEFENSWLFQREKIDNLSKNNLIIKKINSFFKSDQDVKLMDLGTGTGSSSNNSERSAHPPKCYPR